MLCWMNGEYVEHDALKISPFDHGFLYGLGFFETFRTYNGKPLFLKEHFARLQVALEAYHITMPYTVEEIAEIIVALNEHNGGEDGYFRLNVSAGEHEIGLAPVAYNKPNVILFRKVLPPVPANPEKTAVILQTRRNLPEVSDMRFKGHHYGNNVFARFELPSLASQEGIFLTREGYVAEGITSNIFWVKEGVIYTPSLQAGILAGITRANVLQLAAVNGYEVREGLFTEEQLLVADECFMTTAIQHIVPIQAIGDTTYLSYEGPVTKQLQTAYAELIQHRLEGEAE